MVTSLGLEMAMFVELPTIFVGSYYKALCRIYWEATKQMVLAVEGIVHYFLSGLSRTQCQTQLEKNFGRMRIWRFSLVP